jgi:hypothetical protein
MKLLADLLEHWPLPAAGLGKSEINSRQLRFIAQVGDTTRPRPSRESRRGDLDPFDYRPRQMGGELPPEMLRLGTEYAHGRKSTNTNPRWPEFDEDEEDESSPTMIEHGGGGGGREWRQSFWCWPLPLPGPLQLVCEWPSMEIPLTRHEIDAQLILDAAERAQEIFPSSS